MPKKNKRQNAVNDSLKKKKKNRKQTAKPSAGLATSSSKANPPRSQALIMAIDFGTTYSGVAWVSIEP